MPDGIGLAAAIGGAILFVVLVFAVLSNRKRSAAEQARTEQATHDLYADIDNEDKRTDPDPKNF